MRAIVLFFCLTGMLSAGAQAASESSETKNKLNVVSTIKPLQALVLGIAADKVNAEQLIPDFASPHFYQFKPSDLRKVNQADVVFRIDPGMEAMLNHVLEQAQTGKKVISLSGATNIQWLPYAGPHKKSDHDESGQAASAHDEHDSDDKDMHIWTSVNNVLAMMEKISAVLGELDPQNKDYYQSREQNLKQEILQVNDRLEEKLKPLRDAPYLVFHNSWQYFAKEHQLREPLVVSYQESVSPGARTIPLVRKKIKDENIACLFTQPNMNLSWVDTLVDGLPQVKVVEVDVTASRFKMEPQMYPKWLAQLGDEIIACLSTGR